MIDALVRLLIASIDSWWVALGRDGDSSRDQLAQAEVLPLFTRGEVVFVKDMHTHLVANGGPPGSGCRV